ncbi:MAG: sugar transferase [Proteobacteria bacterium]|jgi:lipopolysaccharide/colanic/teichoic acid biosynthesis glycosyltransferase|nr:sugar transferase [Pseudomonadota bacterium]
MLVKRLFDIICSIFGLVILLPFFCIIAILIKSTSRGSVFFRQNRVGLYGKIFAIHKFRTMVTNAETLGPKITIGLDKRVTKIGYLLRKTKLDELPQLIDVLYGTMSLVGPRPEVPEYVDLYPQEDKDIIFSVRPGITDWASIKMIDENEILAKSDNPRQIYIQEIMPQKIAFAVKYVKGRSFIEDIIIIFTTFIKIIRR